MDASPGRVDLYIHLLPPGLLDRCDKMASKYGRLSAEVRRVDCGREQQELTGFRMNAIPSAPVPSSVGVEATEIGLSKAWFSQLMRIRGESKEWSD